MIRALIASAGLAFGFFQAAPAIADPIPVSWSFRNPLNEIAFPTGATGGLTFPNTEFQSFQADQVILASSLASYSIAADSHPDVLRDQSYSFALDLRDDASGEVKRLQFKGVISGEIWKNGASLQNQYLDGSTQTASLGGNLYSVSLTEFTAPNGYGEANAGSFLADVHINSTTEPDPTTDSTPNATPEPATLVIAGIGLAGAGLFRLNRRGRTAD